MSEWKEHSAIWIKCCYQGQSWIDRSISYCAWGVIRRPHSSTVFRFWDPWFVNINDPLAFLHQIKHLDGILLSENKTTLWVALNGYLFHLPIIKLQVLAQLFTKHWNWNLRIDLLLHLLLNLLSLPDGFIILQHACHNTMDCFFLLIDGIGLVSEFIKHCWILLDSRTQPTC